MSSLPTPDKISRRLEEKGASSQKPDRVEPRQGANDQRWTPGPWYRSGGRTKINGGDTHSIVATVDGQEIVIASVWYNPQTHEGFHDAGLLAAAPDLLTELKWCFMGAGNMERMAAAIAKAEGRS